MFVVSIGDGTHNYAACVSWCKWAGSNPNPGHKSLPQLLGFSRCLLVMIKDGFDCPNTHWYLCATSVCKAFHWVCGVKKPPQNWCEAPKLCTPPLHTMTMNIFCPLCLKAPCFWCACKYILPFVPESTMLLMCMQLFSNKTCNRNDGRPSYATPWPANPKTHTSLVSSFVAHGICPVWCCKSHGCIELPNVHLENINLWPNLRPIGQHPMLHMPSYLAWSYPCGAWTRIIKKM